MQVMEARARQEARYAGTGLRLIPSWDQGNQEILPIWAHAAAIYGTAISCTAVKRQSISQDYPPGAYAGRFGRKRYYRTGSFERGGLLPDGRWKILEEKRVTEREFSYWLCNIEGIGRVTAGRLLKRAGSAQAVYEMKEQELAGLLSAAQLKAFSAPEKRKM